MPATEIPPELRCEDCGGTGEYVGLGTAPPEPCGRCGGDGKRRLPNGLLPPVKGVISSSSNAFKLSLTPGGEAVDITDADASKQPFGPVYVNGDELKGVAAVKVDPGRGPDPANRQKYASFFRELENYQRQQQETPLQFDTGEELQAAFDEVMCNDSLAGSAFVAPGGLGNEVQRLKSVIVALSHARRIMEASWRPPLLQPLPLPPPSLQAELCTSK